MKKLALGAVALGTIAGAAPAYAQDATNWTGFYVGGRIGYTTQPSDLRERLDFDTNGDGGYNDFVRTTTGADAFSPGFCDGAPASSLPTGCSKDQNAVTYMGHVGFDLQFANSPIVVGGVVEYGNSNINDSVTGFSTTPANYVITRSLRGAGSARARAGFAVGQFLPYVTGGVSYGKVRYRFGTTNNANAFTDSKGNDARISQPKDDRWGYNYGAGVEAKVAENFSVGFLWLYSSLDDDWYNVQVSRGAAPATNPFLTASANGTNLRRQHSEFNRNDFSMTASFRF